MLVLGIESSCDETAVALVRDGKEILCNLIASQVEVHQEFGGVFPELASRAHIDCLLPLVDQALEHGKPDLIAVANGPGLMGSLLMGVTGAKALSYGWGIPLVGVNHVEAHIYAPLMAAKEVEFPALGLVISGGHTFLARVPRIGEYEVLGTTVDDAVGEAFDKVATLLGFPYPGGPEVEKLARDGNPDAFPFRGGIVKGRPLDFSFSGLKTNVLYAIKGVNGKRNEADVIDAAGKRDVAASFQRAALEDIVKKTKRAFEMGEYRSILAGGGVSNSQTLRGMFAAEGLPIYWPPTDLSLDNGAMIAGLGYHLHMNGQVGPIEAYPRKILV